MNYKRIVLEGNFSQHIIDDGTLTITPITTNPIVYFFLMEQQRVDKVGLWLKEAVPLDSCEDRFCKAVEGALNRYSSPFCISTIEPSIIDTAITPNDSLDSKKIFLAPNSPLTTGFTFFDWEFLCREYLPIYTSVMASCDDIALFYAYRIAMEYWTLSLVGGSGAKGNYKDSRESSGVMDVSGKKSVGGFSDGIGNTYVITKDHNGSCRSMGGSFLSRSMERPIGEIMQLNSHGPHYSGLPMITLKDPPIICQNGKELLVINV